MSGAASSFTEEDRFPLFFLGVSSALMLVFCGVPCLRWFVGLLVVCIRGILRGGAHPRRRSALEDTDHNIESYARAAGNVLSEYLTPLGCLLSVLKYPRWFVAALQLQWHHPRLFSQHVFPHVTRYVVHARRLLLVVWFVSIMLHVNTVPRAVHYETLGLPPTATREEVRSAYRKLSFRYHPDKDASVEARDLYSKIRYAYHRLTGDRGDGDSRFAGEEDVGVGVALPRFLRDTEHEGRTLLLLLTIAFGVPGFLVYWFFLRTPMTYQKRHNSLIRNVALVARLFDALGVPPTLRREEECKHCEMTEKILCEAGLWGATMKREDLLRIVPIPLPTLLKFCLILKQEELHGKRVIQEAKDRLAGVGLDEEACRTAFIQCISQEPWLSAVRSMTAQPFQTKGYANSSYVAPPPHVCEAIAYFLESVLEAIRDDLIPFDIQGKSKKLMKLYEDKTNLLKKMAQIYHTSSSRPPPSLFDRLYDISEEIGTTHADIDRSSIEYLTAQQRRNLRRYLAAANTTMQ